MTNNKQIAAALLGAWILLLAACDKSSTPTPSKPSANSNGDSDSSSALEPTPTGEEKQPAPAGFGSIKGRVVFDGDPPAVKRISMAGNAQCTAVHAAKNNVDNQGRPKVADPGLVVYKEQGNAIPFVFVYIKEGIDKRYDPPDEPVVLDQSGCMYHPHVFGMVAGQGLDIKSSDPFAHNVHSLAKMNPDWNFSQPKPSVKKQRGGDTFNRQEIMVKIKCDVHGWMSSYCGVLYHPFFDVTKDHLEYPRDVEGNQEKWGTFEIKDVPAGDYVLEAWHEKFGTTTLNVSLKADETQEIEFKLGK